MVFNIDDLGGLAAMVAGSAGSFSVRGCSLHYRKYFLPFLQTLSRLYWPLFIFLHIGILFADKILAIKMS